MGGCNRRRVLGVIGAGLPSLLVGCAGSADTATETAQPWTPEPLQTPTAGPPDADWATGAGIDVDTLREYHLDRLQEAGSYTVRASARSVHEEPTPPSLWLPTQTITHQFEAGRQRQWFRHDLTWADEMITIYVGDGIAFLRLDADNETEYDLQAVSRTPSAFRRVFRQVGQRGIPGLADWTLYVAGRRNDRYRYVGDYFGGDRLVPETIIRAETEVELTAAGRVVDLGHSFAGESDGQAVWVVIEIEFSDVGDTEIAKPDWVLEAIARTEDPVQV